MQRGNYVKNVDKRRAYSATHYQLNREAALEYRRQMQTRASMLEWIRNQIARAKEN